MMLTRYRLITYGDKMANDLFDGTKGFALEGGIKDATYDEPADFVDYG